MSRDRTVGDTFYIAFTTRAFATGIPTTLSGTPVVSAYEDASLTQITAGITLGVDHDSVTGLNMLTIVATGGNGFETSKDYQLVITTGTVGGVSVVGEVVGQFSLGLSAAAVDLANGIDGLGAIKTDTAAILIDTADMQPKVAKIPLSDGTITWNSTALGSINAECDTALTDYDGPTNAEMNARTLLAASYFDPAADTVANVTTVATTTNLTNLPSIPANWLTAAGIAASALDGKGDWNIGKTGYSLTQAFPTNFADMSITATTGLMDITQAAADKVWSTAARTITAATNITSDGSAVTMSSSGVVGTVNLANTLTTYTSNTPQTGDNFARLGAPAGASVSADIAAVPTVAEILTTAMTEAYAADGVAPTVSQALFAIQQFLQERSTATTTVTVKKLDGSATAMTFTLDDATTPTSITRAT